MKSIYLENYQKHLLNFLIYLFPATFVMGNAAININIFLICIIGVLFYKKDIFKVEKNIYLISILLFFFFIIFSTLLDFFQYKENTNITRSILYLRYLILVLVLSCMIKKNDINIKFFIFSCLIFSILVSITVLSDEIFNKNIFGIDLPRYHNPGLFGEELIAGGYIQRFACLGIFSIPFFLRSNKKILFYFSLAFLLFSLSVIFSGNRSPLIIFAIFLLLGSILAKGVRLHFLSGLIIFCLVFLTVINFNKIYKEYWLSLYDNLSSSLIPGSKYFFLDEVNKDYSSIFKKMDQDNLTQGTGEGEKFNYSFWKKKNFEGMEVPLPLGSGHRAIWTTAVETWLDKPFTGHGIKSFRIKCREKAKIPGRVCESHTHNYYLELLNDGGLIGTLLIIVPVFFVLLIKIKEIFNIKNKNVIGNFIFYSIFLSLLLEFFPFKSTGNFFSTYNSAYIFMLIGLIINLKTNYKIKN